MARLDLKAAYRSVSVKESHHQYTGLKWRFTGHDQDTYLVDTKLPFGARLSMEAFHRLSRAIQRILHKRGISVIIYLDDILIVAPSHQACQSAMQQAISILRELGFAIAYNKLEGPTQQLTFLGIFISAVTQTLHLPSGKVAELLQLLRIFRCKKCTSLKQLQRLAGKLAWAANVCEAVEFTCNTSMILCALSNTASTKSASTLNSMLFPLSLMLVPLGVGGGGGGGGVGGGGGGAIGTGNTIGI